MGDEQRRVSEEAARLVEQYETYRAARAQNQVERIVGDNLRELALAAGIEVTEEGLALLAKPDLSTHECARIAGTHVVTIRDACVDGRLECLKVRLGDTVYYRIRPISLLEWRAAVRRRIGDRRGGWQKQRRTAVGANVA